MTEQATSLRELTSRKLDLNRVTARLIEAIMDGYEAFASTNIRATFEDLWPTLDALKGKFITAEYRDQTIEGTASGPEDP